MSNRGAFPDRKNTGAEVPDHQPAPRPTREPPTRRRKAALTIAEASAGMLVQRLLVRAPDVVFVKSIIEASEGVANIFAERGGELTIAAPQGRGADLTELLEDIAREVGGQLGPMEQAAEGLATAAPGAS